MSGQCKDSNSSVWDNFKGPSKVETSPGSAEADQLHGPLRILLTPTLTVSQAMRALFTNSLHTNPYRPAYFPGA